MPREGEVRIPSGCAISGIFSRDRSLVNGSVIAKSISVMHERSNGLGGGFAGYGIYPQYKELTRIKNTIDDIAAADITPAVKVQAIAEAKCLYGWIGYIMYDLFGPVPLATDEARKNPTRPISTFRDCRMKNTLPR